MRGGYGILRRQADRRAASNPGRAIGGSLVGEGELHGGFLGPFERGAGEGEDDDDERKREGHDAADHYPLVAHGPIDEFLLLDRLWIAADARAA